MFDNKERRLYMNRELENSIKEEFIEALLFYSKGKISIDEAKEIALTRFNSPIASDDFLLSHKGSTWLAWYYCRANGYWVYQPQ